MIMHVGYICNSDFTEIPVFQIECNYLGQGPNPARQASIKAGLPASVPAWVVSMLCGSSMKAVIQGYLSVATGNCQIVVVGGQENASQVPIF